MIAIVNVGPFENTVDSTGLYLYEIRLYPRGDRTKAKILGTFSHTRSESLSVCLHKAAEAMESTNAITDVDENKPSWESAPEWAMFLARESDGRWYWFENKPIERYIFPDLVCFTLGGKKQGVVPARGPLNLEQTDLFCMLEKRP